MMNEAQEQLKMGMQKIKLMILNCFFWSFKACDLEISRLSSEWQSIRMSKKFSCNFIKFKIELISSICIFFSQQIISIKIIKWLLISITLLPFQFQMPNLTNNLIILLKNLLLGHNEVHMCSIVVLLKAIPFIFKNCCHCP